jgi:hypothetical protein
MIDPASIVPPPHPNDHKISPWIDEQIWGHRLWDSESPWLLFLEFLSVAEACHRDGTLLMEDDRFRPLAFKPYKRMYLRNILFNNEEMLRIAERHSDSASAWTAWLQSMEERAFGIPAPRDFSFLTKRFHSFHEFAAIVAMVRGSDVESASNKRWTSRFLFPFGPNALYEDLIANPTSGTVSRDYVNFGRTGELLYLMLCRSSAKDELRPHLMRILEPGGPWNQLIGLLQPPSGDDERSTRGNSYLPYKQHPTFDRLSADWISVLSLNLPRYDVLPYLVTLGGLHIVLYQLGLSVEWRTVGRPLHLVCEIVAPRKSLVRELSFESYLENNLLPMQAVVAYVDQIGRSNEWCAAVKDVGGFMRCRQILQDRVRWGESPEDYDGPADPDALLSELRAVSLSGHRQHVANVHRTYGREVGLVSKRGTNKLRYAPTDGLLKALLLTNVPDRMELGEFLQRIFDRYGFVIGDRQAENVLPKELFDKKAFQANAKRLEERLGSLGLLKRLSDGCAYVANPYRQPSL